MYELQLKRVGQSRLSKMRKVNLLQSQKTNDQKVTS